MMKRKNVYLILFLSFFLAPLSFSKTVEVKMLNKASDGQKSVFEPAVVFIEKGDSVKFISTNKGHNVASLDKSGSAPDGAKKWKSKVSKDHTQTFNIEGIHGIKCKPHMIMGMVGAVVVGAPHNIEAFSKLKLRGRAKKRFPVILATIKSKKGAPRAPASLAEESPVEAEEKVVDLLQLQKDVTALKASIKAIQEKLSTLEKK
jgi:pseudoazurin